MGGPGVGGDAGRHGDRAEASLGRQWPTATPTARLASVPATISGIVAGDPGRDAMKVTVDRSRCTGHGRCYVLVPEVFSADDDGYSVVLEQEVPAALESRAQLGEANCPERAITCERT